MRAKPFVINLLLISLITLGLCTKYITLPRGFGDSGHYLRMAQSPEKFAGSPWGYRIGVPYLASRTASILDIPVAEAYTILQMIMFSMIVAALFFWLYKGFGLSPFTCALSCLLFIYSFPGNYNLHNVVHVGFAEHLLILLGCIAIYHSRFLYLVFVIAISCLSKESVGMLLIPTYLLYTVVFDNWRKAVLNTSILVAIYIGIFIFVRSGFLFSDKTGFEAYSSFYSLQYFQFVYNYWGGIGGAIRSTATTFGPTWLLSAAGLIFSPKRLKVLVILPILAILQISFATDVQRMVGVGFPIVLALAAFTIDQLDRKKALILVGLSCISFFCYNFYFDDAWLVIIFILTGGLLWFFMRTDGTKENIANIHEMRLK